MIPYYKELFFSFLTLSKSGFPSAVTYRLDEITLKWAVNLECNNSWALMATLVLHNQSGLKDLTGGDFSYFRGVCCRNYGCFWKELWKVTLRNLLSSLMGHTWPCVAWRLFLLSPKTSPCILCLCEETCPRPWLWTPGNPPDLRDEPIFPRRNNSREASLIFEKPEASQQNTRI